MCRHVSGVPKADYFKPRGIPLCDLTEVTLTVEGLEAVRLADLEGLTMEQASKRMGISRHTFGRILAKGHQAIAEALVNGWALRIDGGHFAVKQADESKLPKELSMTIIAVSSEGPTLQDQVDPRFGRAAGFVIVDLDTFATHYIDNGQSQTMAQGAGIQAAELIANAEAGVLLTGVVGPKAFHALSAVGIKVGQNLEGMTVEQAVEKFKAGQVPFADKPNK